MRTGLMVRYTKTMGTNNVIIQSFEVEGEYVVRDSGLRVGLWGVECAMGMCFGSVTPRIRILASPPA